MTYDTAETVEIEDLVAAVAARHGFRMRDCSLIWDGGQFVAERGTHTVGDHHKRWKRVLAEISRAALSDEDPWKYLRGVNAAFERLRRASER